jgi:hypothetical protein
MPSNPEPSEDFAGYMGASAPSTQRLTLYIPTVDRHGVLIPNREVWLREAVRLLSALGGGATVFPNQMGAWFDPDTEEVLEEPVDVAYTFIKPDAFEAHLEELRSFLHRLGRLTDQGEVGFEFDGQFFRIVDFKYGD